jgi:hypothetical protein
VVVTVNVSTSDNRTITGTVNTSDVVAATPSQSRVADAVRDGVLVPERDFVTVRELETVAVVVSDAELLGETDSDELTLVVVVPVLVPDALRDEVFVPLRETDSVRVLLMETDRDVVMLREVLRDALLVVDGVVVVVVDSVVV